MAMRLLMLMLVAAGCLVGGHDVYAASPPVPRALVERIRALDDNEGLPVFVIDKVAARLYVFDRRGVFLGDSPVLLGAARGDHSVPGIGERPLAQVLPEEKTTPAGRFRAERGRNLGGEDVVWVDYDAAVSLHRVRTVSEKERRRERLATPTPLDNRISFGCINVPEHFYNGVVDPALLRGAAMVYILPEVETVATVFGPRFAQPMQARAAR